MAAMNDKGRAIINAKKVELILIVIESKQGLYHVFIFVKSGGNISPNIIINAGIPFISSE